MANLDDLTPEQQKRVEEIREALIAELQEPKGSKKRAIQDIQDLKEDALVTLRATIKHSQNETLKAKVSMWAIDRIVDAEKIGDSDLAGFLNELGTVNTDA